MISLFGHYNEAFLAARTFLRDIVDDVGLFMAGEWDAAWDDLFDCWCGCPL